MSSSRFSASSVLGFLAACLCWHVLAAASWEDSLDHGPGIGKRKGFPTFKTGTDLLESWVKKYPHLIRGEIIGHSYEKRNIKAYILSVQGISLVKPQILLTSLMHAREPAGLTVLLYFIGHILEEYTAGNAEAQYLLTTREIWCIPFVNPDGYVANEKIMMTSQIGARKNRRPTPPKTTPCRHKEDMGVDINRNFGYHWQKKFPACDEEYQGTEPFSEPETQAIKKVCDDKHFKVAINYHTYGEMLTHPFNYAKQELLPKEAQEIYLDFKKVFKWNKFGPAYRTVRYQAIGESDDWMYGEKGIISMSPEVGPERGGFWPSSTLIKGIDSNLYAPTAYGAKKAGLELVVAWQLERRGAAGMNIVFTLHNKGLSTSIGNTLGMAFEPVTPQGDVSADVTQEQSSPPVNISGSTIMVQLQPLESRSSTKVSVAVGRATHVGDKAMKIQLCVAEELPHGTVMCQCSGPARIEAAKATSAGSSHIRLGNERVCAAANIALDLGSKATVTLPPPAAPQSGEVGGAGGTNAAVEGSTTYVSSSNNLVDEQTEAISEESHTVLIITLVGVVGFGVAAHYVQPILKRKLAGPSEAVNADPGEMTSLFQDPDTVGAADDEKV